VNERNPYQFPLWISVFLTIGMVGLHLTGWWISAITTVFLLVAVLVHEFHRTT